jgi:anti-anti-sigma factor
MAGGPPVVTAPVEIDAITADELRRALLDAAADGHATVVVDMTRTGFFRSGGFSVLVGAHRRALAEGGGLRLATAADGPLARALDLTGVGRFIPTFSSLAAALAAGPVGVIVSARGA